MAESEAANALFTEFTTAKVIWLLAIAACTAAVVIRARRRRDRRDGDRKRR